MNRRLLFLLLCVCYTLSTQAQRRAQRPVEVKNDYEKAILADFSFAFQVPGEDFRDRFGNSQTVGMGVDWLTGKKNILLSLHAGILFGTQVKQDVLAPLRTPQGDLIGNSRTIADVVLRQRGMYIHAAVGKIFPVFSDNKRSGIRVDLGLGFLKHRIRI